MATVSNITTTYAGQDLKKWVSAALLEGNTLAKGLISIEPNVKYKAVVKRLDLTGGLVDNDCDFNPLGSYTLTERHWEPKELKLNKQICKQDFHSTWESIEQGFSAHDVLPKSFADYLLALQAASIAQEIETKIWQGDGTVNGSFDGFIKLLENDPNLPAAQEVLGTNIDASNVIAELEKIVLAIPTRLYQNPNTIMYVPANVHQAYILALGGFASNGQGSNGYMAQGAMWYSGQPLTFAGYKLELVNGLPNDVIIVGQKTNFVFGCGLLGDQADLRLIDTSQTLGDDNVRIIAKMTCCVNYAISEDIVTYGIVNAVN